MKYIKMFENNKNTRLDELKKLLSHIRQLFCIEFGYIYKQYYTDDKYENIFLNEGDTSFEITGQFSSSLIFFQVVLRSGSIDDNIVKYIPEYFKTINGLYFYSNNPKFYTTTFEVVDNVDNIIPQITIEDFESKMRGKKYNL